MSAMSSRKLNVLVYSGTGATVESVKHCLYSLRRLLSPNYAVIPVNESVILTEPWAPTCALLVFPGGADLGYCRVLNGTGNQKISQYVRQGGAYLGLCSGGYYGCQRCEFEVGNPTLEVVGRRELAFFPGTCRGGAFSGFAYGTETGARAARLNVRNTLPQAASTATPELRCYFNGGGVFVDADKLAAKGVEVLATYEDPLDIDGGSAALVYCKFGDGSALLSGVHPEFSGANLNPQPAVPNYDKIIAALDQDEGRRCQFLKDCLSKLGLTVSQETLAVPSLSSLHLSALVSGEVAEAVHSWNEIIQRHSDMEFIRGENDNFCLVEDGSHWSLDGLQRHLLDTGADRAKPNMSTRKSESPTGMFDDKMLVKPIILHESSWPEAKVTPDFSHALYFSSLQEYRHQEQESGDWGNTFLYGEVVTSTNTLLEKNPSFLAKLQTGFTLAATTQVAGRGRGTNVWVSPAGSLIMSTVINHPAHMATSRPIIFIQYLAAIAIVESIKSYGAGYEQVPVKLKWPNDIYARDPTKSDSPTYVKIGGILCNCAYHAGSYQVVLGIGINTTNKQPTTSLNALLPPGSGLQPFRIERLLARILTRLESIYKEFCRAGFSIDLEQRYYKHWLHSGQIVTLDSDVAGGSTARARVLGITRDWGMLKAEELNSDADGENRDMPTGRVWALQSDENSFDFWRGLVRRKV